MAENIILIGFMGVGKGRTARALAAATGRYCIDTDDLIETLTNQKIRVIFQDQGEPSFRQREQQTADWLETSVTSTIVSTGGGFFKVSNIQRLGTVIYLHAPIQSIIQSIQEHPKAKKKIKKRPLLSDLKQAKALFEERLPQYRQAAHHEVNVKNKTIDDTVAKILQIIAL